MDKPLAEMTDAELLDYTEAAIAASSFWNGRGGTHADVHRRCDEAYEECKRRTPSGHLYTKAWNRAAQGVCTPDRVPADTRHSKTQEAGNS